VRKQIWLAFALAAFLAVGTKSQEQEAPRCDAIDLPLLLARGELYGINPATGEMKIGKIYITMNAADGIQHRFLTELRKKELGIRTTVELRIFEVALGSEVDFGDWGFKGRLLPTDRHNNDYKIFQYTQEGKDHQFTFRVTDTHLSWLVDRLLCKPKLQLVFSVPTGT
jgi:hypothetical protein